MGKVAQLVLGFSLAYLLINCVTPSQKYETIDSFIDMNAADRGRIAEERERTRMCRLISSYGGKKDTYLSVLHWHGGL